MSLPQEYVWICIAIIIAPPLWIGGFVLGWNLYERFKR